MIGVYEPFKSQEVAKLLIAKANERNIYMNMTKLQKLLYVAYGLKLAVEDEILLDERPKAWPFGPVFPRVRKKLNNIPFKSITFEKYPELKKLENKGHLKEIINLTLDSFGHQTASYLSEWSHMEGSPWWMTVEENGERWNSPIENEYIKEYFDDYLSQNANW